MNPFLVVNGFFLGFREMEKEEDENLVPQLCRLDAE